MVHGSALEEMCAVLRKRAWFPCVVKSLGFRYFIPLISLPYIVLPSGL